MANAIVVSQLLVRKISQSVTWYCGAQTTSMEYMVIRNKYCQKTIFLKLNHNQFYIPFIPSFEWLSATQKRNFPSPLHLLSKALNNTTRFINSVWHLRKVIVYQIKHLRHKKNTNTRTWLRVCIFVCCLFSAFRSLIFITTCQLLLLSIYMLLTSCTLK